MSDRYEQFKFIHDLSLQTFHAGKALSKDTWVVDAKELEALLQKAFSNGHISFEIPEPVTQEELIRFLDINVSAYTNCEQDNFVERLKNRYKRWGLKR